VTRPRTGIAGLSLIAAVLVGCGSSPPTHYYTLTAVAPAPGGSPERGSAEYSVSVGPVTLPEIVDRPQLVVRVGANQVALVDQHRWAEPLKSEIPRVIAENLSQLLGAQQVVTYSQNLVRDAEFRVLVDIKRFDSTVGQTVTIDALWTVRRASGGEPATGRSLAQEPIGGDGYDAIVAAHGRALATVSRDVAESIRAAASTQH